ncbi:MAG: hypothetical protein NTW28_09125 [Candidatus Solibacter sp.]|nr:hypothetical protein [Candidatus Solibacter sp.]
MLRAFSMFSLGAIFLVISPKLRQQVQDAIGGGVSAMDFYSPYSYIAGGLLILVTMVVSFHRGAQAR